MYASAARIDGMFFQGLLDHCLHNSWRGLVVVAGCTKAALVAAKCAKQRCLDMRGARGKGPMKSGPSRAASLTWLTQCT